MEAKLKALKVPELKELLLKANLPVTGKKDDLVARLLDNPAATASITAPAASRAAAAPVDPVEDDLLAPPKAFSWNDEDTSGTAQAESGATAVEPPSTAAAAAAPSAPVATAKTTTANPAPFSTAPSVQPTIGTVSASPAPVESAPQPEKTEEEKRAEVERELEKRRKRAERFGMELGDESEKKLERALKFGMTDVALEQLRGPTGGGGGRGRHGGRGGRGGRGGVERRGNNRPVDATANTADLSKRSARAERFGTGTAAAGETKRPAPAPLDPAEEERRRKRAEKFGTAATTTTT